MNSRWQANKIGLINFWYYDEQEFPFLKGRMLLRGSNGSGKSVTMQSVVPLLLDGNMSPERLDPFGSRDRKMSSYLLEEDDGLEERTGYLYLEFKREDSDTYLTIGMGIRARRGKPLDKWYFSLTDGRRIGKDFFLYKKTDEKVTLSRRELENRTGEGGVVFDKQADYMEYVNRQVFGFDTTEEYKEMIDLLIQLRTPKLSRDFKPSVINDILSDSLQPLSDEDLRPMSEAIENMDTMNLNLKARREARQAAGKIQRVLQQYDRHLLYAKAASYKKNQDELKKLEKEEKDQAAEISRCQKRAEELTKEQNVLDSRKEAMEKERDSLSNSDAVGLKDRELDLNRKIQEQEKVVKAKEKQLAGKQEQEIALDSRIKEEDDRAYEKEKDLQDCLEEMGGLSEEMSFEEHHFFEEEWKEQIRQPYSFVSHRQQFEQLKVQIEQGVEILQEATESRRQADYCLKKKEERQREANLAQRKAAEAEDVLIQVQNEWKEAVYGWNGKNEQLRLSDGQMRELSLFAENYEQQPDFTTVKKMVADVWIEKKQSLNMQAAGKREELSKLEEEIASLEKELQEWETYREPEPPRSQEVEENRKYLQEKGIPYCEFYKMIEFSEQLEKKERDYLEELLLQMGILDALVIDEVYKEQVLSVHGCGCDRYLFVTDIHAGKNLLELLELDPSVDDIFLNQRITAVLSSIGYEGQQEQQKSLGREGQEDRQGCLGREGDGICPSKKEGKNPVSLSLLGNYQLGILQGTITGTYEASFIGANTRERRRLEKTESLRKLLGELREEYRALIEEKKLLEDAIRLLEEEYRSLPTDEDMQTALQMLEKHRREVSRLLEDVKALEGEYAEAAEKMRKLFHQAAKIAEKIYLPCSCEDFKRAQTAAYAYDKYLHQLQTTHELYLQILQSIRNLQEQQEHLFADMEDIRYDMQTAQKALRALREEHTSVTEQLKLTDYEQIKERLSDCITWLHDYPSKIKKCVEEKTKEEARAQQLKNQKDQIGARLEAGRRKNSYLQKCYQDEYALGYVTVEEPYKAPEEVMELLAEDVGKKTLEEVLSSFNKIYFENRGALIEYQLFQTALFGDRETEEALGCPSAKRLDVRAKYKGVEISFYQLLQNLEEEIADLQELIKDGDRELFEDILANTVSRKIRGKINSSISWVAKMNTLMESMNTSSGLKLSLRWKSKTAETEDQLDTAQLVELLKKDYRLMKEAEAAKLSAHFQSKVNEARRRAKDSGGMISFYQVMKDTLDYRKWFEFRLFSQKDGEKKKELTNSVFGTFSGGEKAMAMYVPLFSAVVAKYQGGRKDAPRLISLDEAFAGVDNRNIRDMFRLMAEFEFDFIINSQVLWGDCDTLDALAIYQLLRPGNAKFVTVMPYVWNGKAREMLEHEQQVEEYHNG